MSLTKCLRMTGCMRSMQLQGNFAPMVVPRRHDYKFSGQEVPREWLNILTQDYDFTIRGLLNYQKKSRWKAVKEDHKFVPERHRSLGPDLATAHFLVTRGAKVKFDGRNNWFQQEKQGNVYLPNHFVPGMHLEAIDCSGMQMTYIAFDNMIQLEKLHYLNLSGCLNVDDWCLERMHLFEHSLQFLDLSDCQEITDNGLACLHVLKKLKGLKLSGLSKVQDMELMVLLLEEALPDCTIFGVEPEKLELSGGDLPGDLRLSGRLESIAAGGPTQDGGDDSSRHGGDMSEFKSVDRRDVKS